MHLSRMLEEVLAETNGFDLLSLADNRLDDDGVAHVVEGLRHNVYGLKIRWVRQRGQQGGCMWVGCRYQPKLWPKLNQT